MSHDSADADNADLEYADVGEVYKIYVNRLKLQIN